MFKRRLAALWSDKPDEAPPPPAETPAPPAPLKRADGRREDVTVVERDAQRAKLSGLWSAAVGGNGRVVLLAGEAGLGKTTLAEQFIREVNASDMPHKVAKAVCSAQSGREEPFWPFADAMTQLVSEPARKVTGDVLDAFLDFAPSWASIIPVAGPVVGASLKTAQVVRTRTRSTVAPNPEKLLREYSGALRKVSDRTPVVMFVDDLHWSDAGSIKLLSHLMRAVHSMHVLVVGAYRPSDIAVEGHPLRDLIAEMLRYDRDAQIHLDTLSRPGVESMIRALYPGHKFPAAFGGDLRDRTDGAPLFIVESLHLMQERGEIKIDEADGRWMLTRELTDADLPQSVEAIINKRVERLPADLQDLLALAAVQGSSFDAAVLAFVTARDELDVMKALEPAEKVHAVIEYVGDIDLGDDVTVRYRFTNHLFQRELLETLRGKKRLAAFRKTAIGLDNLWPDNSEDIAPKLAALYEAGKMYDNAARFMIVAGYYARQAGAIPTAVQLYENAEKSLKRATPKNAEDSALFAELQQQIDEALSYLYEVDANYAASAERTARALSAGLSGIGWRRHAGLRMRQASLALRRGQVAEALAILQAIYATLGEASPEDTHSYEAFQLPAELAKVLTLSNLPDVGALFAEDALKDLEVLPEVDWKKPARARLSTSLSMAYHALGHYRRALTLGQDTLETLRELNMVGTFATLLSNLTELYVEVGDFERVPAAAQLMIDTAKDTGNESLFASAQLALGLSAVLRGEQAEALAALEEADRWAEAVKTFEDRPKILVLKVFALLDLNRIDEARAALGQAVPLAAATGQREWTAFAQLAQARYLLATRDTAGALAAAQAAAATMLEEGAYFDEAIARRILGRVFVSADRIADAAHEFERACALFRRIGNDPMAEQTVALAKSMGMLLSADARETS